MSLFKLPPISWVAPGADEADASEAAEFEDGPPPPWTGEGAVAGRLHPEDPATAQARENPAMRRIRNSVRTAASRGTEGKVQAG
jgi:hypothetical protein